MFEVVTLLHAQIEIQSAFAAAMEVSVSRAETLDENVQTALQRLATFPELGPLYFGEIHRLVLNPGPHAVFYSIQNRRVFIHALLDTRQHPAAIRRRLGF